MFSGGFNWKKALAGAISGASQNYLGQRKEMREHDMAKELAAAKQKTPLEMMSGPMRDIILSQSPDIQKQMGESGYTMPDLANMPRWMRDFLKLRQMGGGGGGGFNFGGMGGGGGGDGIPEI